VEAIFMMWNFGAHQLPLPLARGLAADSHGEVCRKLQGLCRAGNDPKGNRVRRALIFAFGVH